MIRTDKSPPSMPQPTTSPSLHEHYAYNANQDIHYSSQAQLRHAQQPAPPRDNPQAEPRTPYHYQAGRLRTQGYVHNPNGWVALLGLSCECGIVNRGGRFGDLDAVKGAGEVGHHMPQNALNRTAGRSRADGPALGMSTADHEKTRTFAERGKRTMREDSGLFARSRMARDIRDIRRNFGSKYDDGIREMLDYAKKLPEYRK